ncbi:MAG TPA: heme-binding protein [Candidatus Dormibacteraeota bacterium]|nr:heme-binding protein [Candidatus Dormibacteraeota bacterium]
MDESFISRNHVKLTTKGAHVVVHSAEKKAAAMGVPQCIAVVDEGGNLLAFSRMDGSRTGSIEIAITKARTAALRGQRTEEIGGGEALNQLRLALASQSNLTGLGGGVPIAAEGQVVGGVGVSSGTSEQDMEVCAAGIAALLA